MVAAAQRIERLDRLERIIQTQALLVQADLALNPFMQLVIDKLRELTQAHGASVDFVDDQHTVVRRASGALAGHLGLRIANATSLSGQCVRTGAVQRCDDSEADERVDRATCRILGVRSMIFAPLRQGTATVGVLKVFSERPQAFDDGDVQMLQLMASAIVAALAKKAALDARNEAEARLRTSEERMRALLEHAHDAVISIDEHGRVSQWNRAAERLFGWSPIETIGQPVADLIVPPAMRAEIASVVTRYATSERLEDAQQRVTLQAVDRAGRLLSVEVSLTATRVAGHWELTAFGHDVSERRQFEAKLRSMALSDGLTGLANRRGFMEALEKAVSRHARGGPPLALLFLDLDGFKEINDVHGHHVGDLALHAFARRLEGCVRKGDTVARLGGDEFTVLAEGVVSLEQARAIADKIIEAMKPPLDVHKLRLRASIGISLYKPPADASRFLREADHAMYHAKHNHDEVEGVSAFMSDAELLD
ncbi:diguanylate cyclase domain-containing protein [Scleromatobacter humisilvae]|uniref:Diguanylate cyclase n=1 Tax=Scleromatobacter humisilvae TaxID=2897159 RepID=A0A9X2C2L2_9BURK|nr:diguanylate cyclase [Scleromatobacter humisilvae]MCK9686165.1 diguanylate cyclase [Scleromatobacter humisilvae]